MSDNYSADNLFDQFVAHQTKGLDLFEDLATAFDYANLHGYKRWMELNAFNEQVNIRIIKRYKINFLGKMPRMVDFTSINAIPSEFYTLCKDNLTKENKQNFIKFSFNVVCNYYKENIEFLESAIYEMKMNKNIVYSKLFMKILKKYSCELKKVERYIIELQDMGYNLDFILLKQSHIHNKYKKKMKKHRKIDLT